MRSRLAAFAAARGGVLALAPALILAVAITGCTGVKAPDLFIVERSGKAPGASLTMLVNEEGGVRCNAGRALKLSDPQIVQARALQEELKNPSGEEMTLAPQPGSVLEYKVRDENGSVRFADNSAGQPKVLRNLVLFILQVAEGVCKLPQQGA